MSALARILTGSSSADDVDTLVDLLAAVATPRGLPLRLTVHAYRDRVLVRLSATDGGEVPAGPGYGQACARLHRLAARWGHCRRSGRNVWWAELHTPEHVATTVRPRQGQRNGED